MSVFLKIQCESKHLFLIEKQKHIFTIKSKLHVESLRYTMKELFDIFTKTMNTSITSITGVMAHTNTILFGKSKFGRNYHSLYHSLSLVVPLANTHCHARCHLLYKLLSLVLLDVSLVCRFINDRFLVVKLDF